MKIAVFGGSGFIGRAVGKQLNQNGYSFIEISRHADSPGSFKADITDYDSLTSVKEQADIVIICTTVLPKKSYADTDVALFVNSNILGIHNILRWASGHGVSRVIYCSTLSMVPGFGSTHERELIDISSHHLYKITKAAGEHMVMGYCRQHQLSYFALRIASVYGVGMQKDIIDLIAEKIKRSEKFTINDDTVTVDYVHVKDVAKAIVACISNPDVNRIINVASGRKIKLRELAALISNTVGKAVELEVRPGNSSSFVENDITSLKDLIGTDMIILEDGLNELLTENHIG